MKFSIKRKKIVLLFYCSIVLLLQQWVGPVYAQEANGSTSASTDPTILVSPTPIPVLQVATASTQVIDIPTPEENPFQDSWSTFVAPTTISQPSLSLSDTSQQSSAQKFQPPHVGSLTKHSFKKNEPVRVTVANEEANGLTAALTDPNGKNVDPNAIQKTTNGIQTTITLDSTQFQFIPGKYTLAITDSTGKTTTQDFTWGVLALNTDKSLYLSNQTADISMAVLDDKGMQVCDADVNLLITTPTHQTTTLSTKDKSIIVNDQCSSHAMSTTADYEAHYQFSGVGDYAVTFSATTRNGTNSIDDTFHVVNSVPFDVQRVSGTRLYPYNTYPMIFHITANQDFNGSVVETAPANFQISPFASASAQTFTSSNVVMPIPNMMAQFGVSSLTLSLPFTGNYQMVQGFGVALTDPIEAAFYNQFGLAGHDGLDFALPDNTPVLAADSGTVSFAGDGAYGTMVVIDSAWGRSYYGHLSSTEVKVGDSVKQGQEIGLSGHSGHVTGPHLHFGIKPKNPDMQNGFFGKVDPTPYLAALSDNSAVLGIATANISQSQKIITWDVSLKKGESIDVAYNYQSPPQSPAFYTMGPLKFVDNNKQVAFQEARSWQLAIDADESVGPTDCTTATGNTNTPSIGTIAWTNPTQACDSNSSNQATLSLTGTAASDWLLATMNTNHFNIASTAKIDGIVVSVTRTGSTNGSNSTTDNAVRIVKGGSIGTTDKSGSTWSTSPATVTYGTGTTDLWGLSWTPTDVNATTFGAAISAKGTSASGSKTITPSVNQISLTVYYNMPPNAPTGLTHSSVSNTSENLTMSATDPDSDSEEYKAYLYTGASASTDCSANTTANAVQSYIQPSSQTGWDNTSYASGATATLTTTGLTAGTTYYWEAAAIDPSGTNAYGSFSSCDSFTTSNITGPTLDQLLRHGEWFNSGVRQSFTF